jgi:hypothetical protein
VCEDDEAVDIFSDLWRKLEEWKKVVRYFQVANVRDDCRVSHAVVIERTSKTVADCHITSRICLLLTKRHDRVLNPGNVCGMMGSRVRKPNLRYCFARLRSEQSETSLMKKRKAL